MALAFGARLCKICTISVSWINNTKANVRQLVKITKAVMLEIKSKPIHAWKVIVNEPDLLRKNHE